MRWAFFARKFDNSLESSQLKVGRISEPSEDVADFVWVACSEDSLDTQSNQNARKMWTSAAWLSHANSKSSLHPFLILRSESQQLVVLQLQEHGFTRYSFGLT